MLPLCSLGFVLRPHPSPAAATPPNKDMMASLGRQFAGQVNYQSVRMTPFALCMSHLIFGIKGLPYMISFCVARERFTKVRSRFSSVHARLPGTQPISRAMTSSSVLLSELQTCTRNCPLESAHVSGTHFKFNIAKPNQHLPFKASLWSYFFSSLYSYLIAQART